MNHEFLKKTYNRNEFITFCKNFLSDFTYEESSIQLSNGSQFISAQTIGHALGGELTILEIKSEPTNLNKRIAITKEAFSIMRNHAMGNALIAFDDGRGKWRLSLLVTTLKLNSAGRVINETSNPRRYSYLLGAGAKIVTPYKYLIEKGRVEDLKQLQERFSVEAVNKQFYSSIADLFTKLIGGKRGAKEYPGLLKLNGVVNQNTEHQEFAVRLIGRIIFSWFLKEKKSAGGVPIVPGELLSLNAVTINADYYHSILEPLFFEVFNKSIDKRHVNLQKAPFSTVPYLNGGLFSPQRNDFYNQNTYSGTGTPGLTHIPDSWFKELFSILDQYNFTVDENTSYDVDLSIDPEMLGRIFENLLAEINPETGESARKSTGSFYTPREIVDYMVDSSLQEFLKNKTNIEEVKLKALISWGQSDDEENPLTKEEKEQVVYALANLTILDPACGSGAYPMGILQKVVYILQQVDERAELWIQNQLKTVSSPELRRDIEDKYKSENYDYLRKLGVIRESIFGVDIQTIATEISRLRCFLTLIIDEDVDDELPNRGIKPLPNLEFKFVTANTLIKLPEQRISTGQIQQNFFDNSQQEKIDKMLKLINEYFSADSNEKIHIIADYRLVQNELWGDMHRNSAFGNKSLALTGWDPFNNMQSSWFEPEWMFGLSGFDIVIGNPPYGAKLSNTKTEAERLKIYFKSSYQSAKTIKNIQKGSLDTFSLFTEKGFDLLNKNGTLVFIVPLSIVTSDSITGLHKILFENCKTIKVSNYAKRPVQIFNSALTANSIVSFTKTYSKTQELWTTKLNRLTESGRLQELINNLQFTNGLEHQLFGRIPKISDKIEDLILSKLFNPLNTNIEQLQKNSGDKIYYRAAGGRYFNVITDYANGLSSEKSMVFDSQMVPIIGTLLSSTLFWWYQQIYTDCLNLKAYEIGQFPVPTYKLSSTTISNIQQIWKQYSDDIEKKAEIQKTSTSKTYNVSQFKVYKLRKSKAIIDKIDNLVCELYGLTEEETNFIKNYEIQFRMSNDV